MSAVTDRTAIARIVHDRPDQLKGFSVVAIDGEAGCVTGDQDRVDDGHLVVHTGNRLFGHDVVIEAEAISTIDPQAQEIRVDRVTEWVKQSPQVKHMADPLTPA